MSTLVTVPQPTDRSLKALIQRHPLPAFFILAFGLTWPWLIADALGSQGILPFRLPIPALLLMSYGPTFAALIVTGATTGKAGIHALLSRLLIWRVGLVWYIVAILGPGLLMLLANGLYALLGGAAPALPTLSLSLILSLALQFVVLGLINGEEIGWRGYALPHLQANRSALVASLILGTIEALFHLPLFFTFGSGQSGMHPLAFLALSLGLATLFTWLYNNTRGSLLLAYMIHAAVNTWANVLSPDVTGLLFWLQVGVICLAAVIVVIVFGAQRLTRQPAGSSGM